MIKVKLFPHSVIDVITNSSTEIFCRIISDEFLKEIQKELSKVLGREIDINPLYDWETGDEDRECIQFEMERYSETDQLQEDFVSLIDNYLKNTIGENNYKIDQNVD